MKKGRTEFLDLASAETPAPCYIRLYTLTFLCEDTRQQSTHDMYH
jgi:hypothetical protein